MQFRDRLARALLGLSLACAAAPMAQAEEGAASTAAPQLGELRVAIAHDGSVVALRDIADPQNPFSGKYSEYDRWLYAHYIPELAAEDTVLLHSPGTAEAQGRQAQLPAGWAVRFASVDAQGWLIPLSEHLNQSFMFGPGSLRDYLERGQRLRREGGQIRRYSFYAAGVLDAPLREAEEQQSRRSQTEGYPRIPAWLGEHPPCQTVFVPNGEILTYGPLDLHVIDERGEWYAQSPPGEKWYRYSAAGQLLGQYELDNTFGDSWASIYDAQYEERLQSQRARGLLRHQAFGMSALLDQPTEGAESEPVAPLKIYEAWDYDGSPVDLDAPIPLSRRYSGRQFPRESLKMVYQAQLELGLTDSRALGPFWGQADGPVVVDPAPRPRRKFATRWLPGTSRSQQIEIRALDDPQNPYRGRYEPWDYWLLDNLDRQNPRLNDFFAAEQQRKQAEREKAKAEGREPDPLILAYHTYEQSPDDPWITERATVDSQGQLIPLRAGWEDWASQYSRDLRDSAALPQRSAEYHAAAGGLKPQQLAQDQSAAYWQLALPLWPAVPQWLAEHPVAYAVFLPDGSLISLGELGSLPLPGDGSPRGNLLERTGRIWCHYSAAGELLASYAAVNSYDWQLALAPQVKVNRELAGLQGQTVEETLGFMLVRATDGSLLSAYDYNGQALDTSQPIRRDKRYCELLAWNDIAIAWRLQQAQD